MTRSFSFACAAGFLLSDPPVRQIRPAPRDAGGGSFLIISTIPVGIATTFERPPTFRVVQGLSAFAFPPLILASLNGTLSRPWPRRSISLMSPGFPTASIVTQLYAIALEGHGLNSIEQTFPPISLLSLSLIFPFVHNESPGGNRNRSLIDVYGKTPSILLDAKLKWLCFRALCTLSVLVAFHILLDGDHLDGDHGARVSAANIDPLTTRLVALPGLFASLLAPRTIARIGAISLIGWRFPLAAVGVGSRLNRGGFRRDRGAAFRQRRRHWRRSVRCALPRGNARNARRCELPGRRNFALRLPPGCRRESWPTPGVYHRDVHLPTCPDDSRRRCRSPRACDVLHGK